MSISDSPKNRFSTVSFFNSSRGFTLLEVAIVIVIVTVMITIGVFFFLKTQAIARDAKRKADLDSIANVLEDKYDDSLGVYPELDSVFKSSSTSSRLPKDPIDNSTACGFAGRTSNMCYYCYRSGTGECSGVGTTASVDDLELSELSKKQLPKWTICANLEAGKSLQSSYYCRSNQR